MVFVMLAAAVSEHMRFALAVFARGKVESIHPCQFRLETEASEAHVARGKSIARVRFVIMTTTFCKKRDRQNKWSQ